MNIVIVTSIMLPMPPVKGGAVQNLIKLFLDDNEKKPEHRVHVFSFFDSEAKKQASQYKFTKFHYINNPAFLEKIQELNMGKFSRAAVLMREKKYVDSVIQSINADKEMLDCDLILLENCPQFSVSIKKAFPQKKLFCHLHNDYINCQSKNAHQIIESIDRVICVSDYIGKQVRSVSDKADIVTLHNGVAIKKENSEEKQSIRNKYGVSQEKVLVIFTGRLIPDKGAHVLLEAYSKMKNKDMCKLLFLGSQLYGKNVEDKYLQKLKSLAQNYQDNIHFTGYVPYEKISNYYAAADIGVIPSLWEDPCPLTVIECLRYGIPIITTDSGGIPEIVDGDCSVVLHRDNMLSQRIAESLDKLIENKELIKRMSSSAVERSEFFSDISYISHFKQLILDA